MPEDKKWEIADAADMIVSGFAFTKRDAYEQVQALIRRI